MEDLDLLQIGINSSPLEHVLRLAHLTLRAGLDGVVCSPKKWRFYVVLVALILN